MYCVSGWHKPGVVIDGQSHHMRTAAAGLLTDAFNLVTELDNGILDQVDAEGMIAVAIDFVLLLSLLELLLWMCIDAMVDAKLQWRGSTNECQQ
jgi:hypothetical protein